MTIGDVIAGRAYKPNPLVDWTRHPLLFTTEPSFNPMETELLPELVVTSPEPSHDWKHSSTEGTERNPVVLPEFVLLLDPNLGSDDLYVGGREWTPIFSGPYILADGTEIPRWPEAQWVTVNEHNPVTNVTTEHSLYQSPSAGKANYYVHSRRSVTPRIAPIDSSLLGYRKSR